MSKRTRYGISVIVAAGLLVGLLFLPVNRWAVLLVEWIQGAGALGVVVYALAYILATLFLLPGSILTAGAGFGYGPIWGTLLVSPVSVVAAALAFVLGRTLARNWVSRRMEQYPRFASISEAIGQHKTEIALPEASEVQS